MARGTPLYEHDEVIAILATTLAVIEQCAPECSDARFAAIFPGVFSALSQKAVTQPAPLLLGQSPGRLDG
jgi:hypothetical protein